MRLNILALITASAAAACSSSPPAAAPDGGGDSGVIGCEGDTRAQAYSPGMSEPGKDSVLHFELASAAPPPTGSTGTEVWTLKVLDGAGAPVSGATFPVMKAWMPLHGHGTATIQVTDNKDGTYTLSPLYFYMAGLWEIDITAQSGGKTDSASFFFCLQ